MDAVTSSHARSIARMLAVSAVALACGAAPHAPDPPLANVAPQTEPAASVVAGNYRALQSVPIVCHEEPSGWCEEEAEDTLAIRKVAGGAIGVEIDVVRTNGHTCSFEGVMQPDPDAAARWVYRTSADDEEGACELVLEHTASMIEIRADGCRYYCGVRASLDAEFAFPPVSP